MNFIKSLSLLFIGAFVLSSCGAPDFVYSELHSLKDQKATYLDTLNFDYSADKMGEYHVYVVVRHTKEYEYSNIWLKALTDNQIDRVEVPLFDKTGKELGVNSGGFITTAVLWKTIELQENESLSFSLVQNMRRNPLEHISEIGVYISENPKE